MAAQEVEEAIFVQDASLSPWRIVRIVYVIVLFFSEIHISLQLSDFRQERISYSLLFREYIRFTN